MQCRGEDEVSRLWCTVLMGSCGFCNLWYKEMFMLVEGTRHQVRTRVIMTFLNIYTRTCFRAGGDATSWNNRHKLMCQANWSVRATYLWSRWLLGCARRVTSSRLLFVFLWPQILGHHSRQNEGIGSCPRWYFLTLAFLRVTEDFEQGLEWVTWCFMQKCLAKECRMD